MMATVGDKHIKFWTPKSKNAQKGLFGKTELMTSFACCAYDSQGRLFAGSAKGHIYLWVGHELKQVLNNVHKDGFISAMRFEGGKIYSGGKDGNVVITDMNSLAQEKTISFGVMIRAIDVEGTAALIGCRNGTIYQVKNINTGDKTAIMESHSDGEVWGITAVDNDHIITTGDDNQIKKWNTASRKCEKTAVISNESR